MNKHGTKWITREKRLAIYLRDGMCCAYCGSVLEDGIILTLDHIVARSNGGSNHESNLVTCCSKCNSSRGNRSITDFIAGVAAYINHGVTTSMIMNHVVASASRDLWPFRQIAREIINSRSSWSEALQEANRS